MATAQPSGPNQWEKSVAKLRLWSEGEPGLNVITPDMLERIA